MLLNAFRRLFNNSPNRKARRASSRPELLQLEGRIVPANFPVTSLADTATGGTLREAIILANTTPGNDQISFNLTGSSPYTITLAGELPNIIDANTVVGAGTAGTLTINGLGASSLIIDAAQGLFKIFAIVSGGNLSISGVTVSGANANSGGAFANSGILNISNSTISGNIANQGGGIFNNTGATLNLTNSTLSGNTAPSGGGGIANKGTVTVSNSTIFGNYNGSHGGGGILNYGTGTLNISNSTISGNTAGSAGGGISNFGTLTLTNSTLSGNITYGGGGGGIVNAGSLTVTNSTLSNNFAPTGGGIFNNPNSTVSLTDSTISGNSATSGSGGGMDNRGTITVTNSTISGNTATNFGGGIFNNPNSTVSLTNSTLSGNSATSGGGIYNSTATSVPQTSPAGILNIANTIIANSTTGGDYAGGGAVNLISGATAANNLITQLAPIPGIGDWATTVTSVQLNLGTLANNGGPTQTLALLTGSVAINAGNATISNAAPISRKDQRGINRTTSDIGAYSSGIQVNTTADTVDSDPNVTSLREAITLANTTAGDDQISFNLSGSNSYTITLASALPTIVSASTSVSGGTAGTVTITGPGASSLTISGSAGGFNIFNIASGGNLSISGVEVSGAQITGSGGAFNSSGTLTITNSTIRKNTSTGGAGAGIFNNGGILTVTNSTISDNTAVGFGSGISSSGTLTITNSTISDNTAGGFGIGGGIFFAGTGTVSNSTISGNSATNSGGGIGNFGNLTVTNSTLSGNTATSGGGIINNGGATLTLTNSTLSGNSASSLGGGIFNVINSQQSTVGTLNIANTIIANSTNGGDYAGGGTVGTNTNNLVEDGNIGGTPTGIWSVTGDPLLATLANNGGPTKTMALGVGSPAISTTLLVTPNLDQRGFTRINNDIGAYTYYLAPTVTIVSPTSGPVAGGTVITITGTNFVAGPNVVTIGGVAATNVNFVSPTTITATTPAGTAGANKSVLVTSAGGTNAANTLFTNGTAPTPPTPPAPPPPTPPTPPTSTAPLITGTPTPPSSSASSTVNLYNPATGEPTGTAVPFPGFNGPVKVVSGDFDGDGVAELVAGAGFGGGPAIAILNSQTGEVMQSFFAFDPAFTGGVFVAVQDTNGDGILDIIASAGPGGGPGGGPEVRIFNGANLNVLRSFFAYAEDFTGGVSVASIDFNGDGILDLVTGAGPGGAPHVKVYDGATNSTISQWYAYPVSFTGGVFVAVGDIGNDGTFEVVTGAGPSGAPVVAVWNPATGAPLAQFMAYAEDFTGGVRVGVNDGNGDGVADILTGAGPGGGPHVKAFSFPALDLLFEFYSGEQTNPGGVFVA